MKKTFLLACFLFLLAGLKAQQKPGTAITATQKADSVRKFITSKNTSTKKPQRKPQKKQQLKWKPNGMIKQKANIMKGATTKVDTNRKCLPVDYFIGELHVIKMKK
jgi:hypothetical protein